MIAPNNPDKITVELWLFMVYFVVAPGVVLIGSVI